MSYNEDDGGMEIEAEGDLKKEDNTITQEDSWLVADAYFLEKGLVRQQLSSFSEFVAHTVQEMVASQVLELKPQEQFKPVEASKSYVKIHFPQTFMARPCFTEGKIDILSIGKGEPVRRTCLDVPNEMVGSGGLISIDWNVMVCLMGQLDLYEVVILSTVCNHLKHTIGPFFDKVSTLVRNFPRNKLSLSLWLDTMNFEKDGHIPVSDDSSINDIPCSVEFLLYQSFKTSWKYVLKSLFKVTLPSNEVLLVCQSHVSDTANLTLAHHGLCIYHNNQEDYLCFTYCDDEGWNKDPHLFLKKFTI
eukprot:TRINITY_DN514_c0_g1_i19.p1 TRINITY_DN514_c0_g1~~TRINITY_DN514_c0_g1_i19.p1  ORF type:complete len:303 (+),score=66.00 TRINITY_DN514_c0_g1_i19:79-987(+)